MLLIGVDFSINKPGVTILKDGKYSFYGWPYNLQKKLPAIYEEAGVNIINRTDVKEKGANTSEQMRFQVENAQYIAEAITDTLKPFLGKDTYIAFEGMSYGSSGDVILQLGGYKYMLMSELSKYIPFDNMFTYAPTSVKKTAGCSKRGLGKHAVIESFIFNSKENSLRTALRQEQLKFMKKGGNNYIDHLDDIVDSYWVLETMKEREELK